ncbi:MAG: hypothetical protein ACM3ON_10290 [Chloroflexota bacterium]
MSAKRLPGATGPTLQKSMDRIVPARWRNAFSVVIGPLLAESRGLTVLFALALVLSLLLIPSYFMKISAQREAAAAGKRYAEFSGLAKEYLTYKKRVDAVQQRKNLSPQGGIIRTMDEIVNSVGVKGKVKSIKDAGTSPLDDQLKEERAELQVEKLSLNELVNVLYRIDNAPVALSVKGITIRKTFENPRLLDVGFTVSLVTSSPPRK